MAHEYTRIWNTSEMELTGRRGKGRGRERENALRKTCPSASLSTTNEEMSMHPNRVSLSYFVNCSTGRESIIRVETITRGFRMLKTEQDKQKCGYWSTHWELTAWSTDVTRYTNSNFQPLRNTSVYYHVHYSPAKGHIMSQMYPGYTLTHFFMI